MGLTDAIWRRVVDLIEPRQEPKNLEPFDDDKLHDIGDLTIDYYWDRCMELLPQDWSLQLGSWPLPDGHFQYAARARLEAHYDFAIERPSITTTPRSTALRAIEDMFYSLRDML